MLVSGYPLLEPLVKYIATNGPYQYQWKFLTAIHWNLELVPKVPMVPLEASISTNCIQLVLITWIK